MVTWFWNYMSLHHCLVSQNINRGGQFNTLHTVYFSWNLSTARCHCNMVKYNMVLDTTLQWLRRNLNQEFEPTKDTPYLALTGELWGVFCENFGKNWPRYNGTALHIVAIYIIAGHWKGTRGLNIFSPKSPILYLVIAYCCSPGEARSQVILNYVFLLVFP